MNFVHEAVFSYPTGRQAELRALSGLNYALSYGLGFGSSEFGLRPIRAAELCGQLLNPLDFTV